MKKLSIIIFLIALVGLFSCKKDENRAVLGSATAPVLTVAGGDSIVLKKSDADIQITYTWTAASFGLDLVKTYSVQVDKQGNNFKDPITLGTVTNDKSLSILTSDLNNKLLTKEFNPDSPEPLALEFRVMVTLTNTYTPTYSAAVKKVVTPYYVKIIYPCLFVPGNYQGWNPADSTTSIPSLKANTSYEGYLWMSSSALEYKYTVGPSWTTNYGDDGGTGTLTPGGANIKPGTGPGYYHLKVNLTSLTHSYLKTDWSVIGDATPGGWNTDTDMAYDSIAKVWKVTVDLTTGGIKFRANHDWTLNYGDTGATGALNEGGDNIAVTVAGNYTVTLNLSGAIYRYNLKKN